MKAGISRRAMLLAAGTGMALTARAQTAPTYPSQMVKIVVPFAPGATADALARRLAQKLQQAWKRPVIVENRPGAGGSIATQFVARSAPDGHTVLLHLASILQFPHLFAKKPYVVSRDLTPVTRLIRGQLMLAIQPDIPAKNLQEFVALAKARPGTYNYGSYGNGTTPHIQGAAFARQAGIDINHVPFSGTAPLMQALMGKHITAAMLDVVAAQTMKGSLRLLAATGPDRWPSLLDVPSFKELGYTALDTAGWTGFFMPAGTPPAVVQRFADEIQRTLKTPELQAQIDAMGLIPYSGSVQDFALQIQNDDLLFERIIRENQITLD
jgi:tripartite-type tricarboxylate transporter receptor subunit TctC